MTEQGGHSVNDLIEVDLSNKVARLVEQKGECPPAVNSCTLVHNTVDETIVLFGGANDALSPAFHFYTLDLSICLLMQRI
jgi:hypothetical protein